jgi:hypothetical protein
MSYPPTRPDEVSRQVADAMRQARIDVSNDQQYREAMLQTVTEIRVKVDILGGDFQSHVRRDEQNFKEIASQFGTVSQTIGNTIDTKKVAMVLACFTAFAGFLWFVVTVVEKMKP